MLLSPPTAQKSSKQVSNKSNKNAVSEGICGVFSFCIKAITQKSEAVIVQGYKH